MNIHQATHTKTFKRKALFGLLLFFCVHLFLAQNKLIKLDKEFSFSQVPLLKLNSSHTKIVISSWDKSKIGVSAYLLGAVDDEYLKNVNSLWEIDIQSLDSIFILKTDGSKQLPIKVISNYSSKSYPSDSDPSNVLLNSMLNPRSFKSDYIQIPEVLQERIDESKFNFDAYKQLGETYFKIWEYNLVKDLDEDSVKEVRDWYNKMSSKLINVSVDSNIINVSNKLPKNNVSYSIYESYTVVPDVAINKIIELKLPKGTLSYINTRFGSVEILDEINNLQANLKYTTFNAESINGSQTDISVSSAPVQIKKWNTGTLQLKYVKSSEIGFVDTIQLMASSSKLLIHLLATSGKFESTFSQLGIENIDVNFKTLSFLSTNSDLVLSLPNQSYNFVYSGEMSGIKIPPNKLELKSLGDYRNLVLHGYSQSRNTDREIQMNMANSQIVLK